MQSKRCLLAGALLVLAVVGCSEDPSEVKGRGVYSPIIFGLAITSPTDSALVGDPPRARSPQEPAVRGAANGLRVLVTNPNDYSISYHWTARGGVLTDSTGPFAVWAAPDTLGTYEITVSIQARDDAESASFFKQQTYHVLVDNEYARWTRSEAVQFDPVMGTDGTVVYAQFSNVSTGASELWGLGGPLLGPMMLTPTFFSASSPTVRSTEPKIAFAGRARSSDTGQSIWLVPSTGADTTTAMLAVRHVFANHRVIGNPRFALNSNILLYNSDSLSVPFPKLWYKDVLVFSAPVRVMTSDVSLQDAYWRPTWGPDSDASGVPDSIVAEDIFNLGIVGQIRKGAVRVPAGPGAVTTTPPIWLSDTTATQFDWSPDGQYIVFTKKFPGRSDRDIWIIHSGASSTAGAIPLTFGPGDDSSPRFTPDGERILFVSNRADRYGLNGLFPTERRGTNIWSARRFDRP